MAKNYEQLKQSFTMLNEMLEDSKKKEDLKVKADAKYQSLLDELEQIKGLRAETLEAKILGQATDGDLKKLDTKILTLEKDMAEVSEEFKIINSIQNKTLYQEHEIIRGFSEFLSAHREGDFLALENGLRAAKDAYMEKFHEYVQAIKDISELRGDIANYMDRKGMKNGRYNLPRFVQRGSKSIFVDPKH